MDLVDEQIIIETNAHQEAKARYELNQMRNAKQGQVDGSTQSLLSRLVPYFAEDIDVWMNQTKAGLGGTQRAYFRELRVDAVVMAMTTLRVVFTEMLVHKGWTPLTRVAGKVHRALHVENSFKELSMYQKDQKGKGTDAKEWRALMRKLVHDTSKSSLHQKKRILEYAREVLVGLTTSKPEDSLQRGLVLVKLLVKLEAPLGNKGALVQIFQLRRQVVAKGKNSYILEFTPTVEQHLAQVKEQISGILFTQYPMVVTPLPWEGIVGGGYLTPKGRSYMSFVKSRNIHLYKDGSISPDVFEAVNNIQETPWRINRAIYGVMSYCAVHCPEIVGLPVMDRDEVVGEKLSSEEWEVLTSEEKQNVVSSRKEAHANFNSNLSQARALKAKLSIARRFAKYEKLYFPHTLDFRGRVYPIASPVNPQSDKIGQALLQFATPKALGATGRKWLAIGLANVWGLDNVSFTDRLKFVEEEEENILDAAREPIKTIEWWSQADNPFGFLAFCVEWARYLKDPQSFVSYLPIKLDATSNGLQHYSAIFRDQVGAVATNLVDGPRSDIYKIVASKAAKIIEVDVEATEDLSERQWKRSLLSCMNRNVCKPATMCLPYGISLFGATDDIMEMVRKGKLKGALIDNTKEGLTRGRYLAQVVLDGVSQTVGSAIVGMRWLKEVDKAIGKQNKTLLMKYVTKIGFPFYQQYYKSETTRINTFVGGARVQLQIKKPTKEIDNRKSNIAIAPNTIHCQDATHLMMCALEGKRSLGITSFSFIHDSYGVHACDTEKFRDVIRDTFVSLYEGDTLGDMRQQWAAQYPTVELPPVPYEKYGKLNIQDIRKSTYIFN